MTMEKESEAPSAILWGEERKQYSHLHAILVGVCYRNQKKEEVQEHLQELELLSQTHHIPVVGTFFCTVRAHTAATFLGTGKVEELRQAIEDLGADLVIFDDEITPAQQRNLETLLKVPVIDRTEIILGVFADRARSREAKLQVSLAQVKYMYPRLKRLWTHLSRQVGGGGGASGGGYLKGAGEKQIEVDRRILKRQIEQLTKEIKDIALLRDVRKQRRIRTEIPVFAIVGYTNVGKSTLMNALTQAGVYIEDKLFATLDTTTRRLVLPNKREVLLSDTVGFIRKLPHLLVAAFKSTLEEAVQADVLIHLIDASHPAALEQAKTTLQVIDELTEEKPHIMTVLNKMDQIMPASPQHVIYQKLRLTYPRIQEISAKEGTGLNTLLAEMARCVAIKQVRLSLRIPQSHYHLVTEIIRIGKIIHQEYDDNDILIEAEVPENQINNFCLFTSPQ